MPLRGVALTGAGISAESGVPLFRGGGGMGPQGRPEGGIPLAAPLLATPEVFARDPVRVWEWYAWRREIIARAAPNPAHRTLAEMEAVLPAFALITQNVDGLHPQAGSRRAIELRWPTRSGAGPSASASPRGGPPSAPPWTSRIPRSGSAPRCRSCNRPATCLSLLGIRLDLS